MYPKWYICLSEGVHLRLAVEGKNIFIHYSFQILFIHMNLSEPYKLLMGLDKREYGVCTCVLYI